MCSMKITSKRARATSHLEREVLELNNIVIHYPTYNIQVSLKS